MSTSRTLVPFGFAPGFGRLAEGLTPYRADGHRHLKASGTRQMQAP